MGMGAGEIMRKLIIPLMVIVGIGITPVWAQIGARPPLLPPPGTKVVEFSDEAVVAAIDKGVQYLYSTQKSDGNWGGYGGKDYPVGPSALAAYALLESGADAQTPKMKLAIDWLRTSN
jgi:hypothetical protein